MYEVDDKTIKTAIGVIERYQIEKSDNPNIQIGCSLAILALQKQIHEKLIHKQDKLFGDIYISCPYCKNTGLINIANGKEFEYCPNCGQALDWEAQE